MQHHCESTNKAMVQSRPPLPRKNVIVGLAPDNKCCVETLPDELLEEIFALVVFGVKEDQRAKVAMKLAHVSSHWRSFVMGIPQFWIHITITCIFDPDVLDQILSLHAHKPLDISIYYPDSVPHNGSLRFWKLIHMVAQQMFQCRQLRIKTTGSNYQLIYKAFSNITNAPRLKFLELIRTDRDPSIPASFPAFNLNLEVVPQVHVREVLWEPTAGLYVSAHELHLRGADAAWLGILRDANRQRQRRMITYLPFGWSTVSHLDISTLFDLKVEGDQAINIFFNSPSFGDTLETLELATLSEYGWHRLDTLFRHSVERFKDVKQLTLSNMPFDEMAFIMPPFLQAFPALKHLAFVAPGSEPSEEFLYHYGVLTRAIPRITYNDTEIVKSEEVLRRMNDMIAEVRRVKQSLIRSRCVIVP
ncbi:hypothetical protein M378DRAFT_907346 [Amanita muscaria Koide BX008]|uniref:F-box domain-containing protein n=1 Tax=Amanita muscaria (strain Koide BX008) TaxID=946122 RepID=A0A0C2SCU8_AMAMK|nr:hypothetical protein M378DRAFT_907346 [Amanita muscaria Koide BX008]